MTAPPRPDKKVTPLWVAHLELRLLAEQLAAASRWPLYHVPFRETASDAAVRR